MNEHDKANLNFILNADNATLKEWYGTLTDDDLTYAQDLLKFAGLELDLRIVELSDNVSDLSDANQVLQKYRLS